MALTMTADQQSVLSVTFADDHGNPAPVDGIPTWTVSDPALLTFATNADGMGGTLVTVGPTGTGQVTVTADADLGAGVTTITGILDVIVVAGMAANVVVTAGTPTPKP